MQTVDATSAAGEPSAGAPAVHRYAFWVAAAVVVALDQATKTVVRSTLERGEAWPSEDWPVRIKHVTNTGAAFGILEDQTAFLIVMACIGLAAIYVYYRNPPFNHWTATLGIGMLLGGAAGNLIDRVRVGRVTDFIDFPNFPSFNVADSSINVGVAIIVIGYLLFEMRNEQTPPADEDG
ncbi:MAG: signal peptidase II [Dehalococcoidia bacterium]